MDARCGLLPSNVSKLGFEVDVGPVAAEVDFAEVAGDVGGDGHGVAVIFVSRIPRFTWAQPNAPVFSSSMAEIQPCNSLLASSR